jgi:hypothetical protein
MKSAIKSPIHRCNSLPAGGLASSLMPNQGPSNQKYCECWLKRKSNAKNGITRAERNRRCFNDIGMRGCERFTKPLGRSSLSATKAPQYEIVINGLAMMPGGLAGCKRILPACVNFDSLTCGKIGNHTSRIAGWQVEVFGTSTFGSAFLSCLALRAPRSVAMVDFFSLLLERMYLMMPWCKMIAPQWIARSWIARSLTGCRPVPIMAGHLSVFLGKERSHVVYISAAIKPQEKT